MVVVFHIKTLCVFYSQGDEATCAYIVLQGRLRSVVRKSDGKKEMLEEHGRGEAVGVVRTTCYNGSSSVVRMYQYFFRLKQ